ncbi:CDP-archaeol synthase [Streptococcus moroccensis]|uniref:CDP-diglyceride synthetase n=1 Tax=Streptococcus moroccensis TaxID=1451356 RepID=A0ABT9YQW5_9STRE|nr:CDP-archaeol synthase [Streptococcus moroccensis]MDQ0222389.1 CDP-diglyceride synthetase [Streptococcus moroccensis]
MLVIRMYATLFPVILAGMANMAFCRSEIAKTWYRPIDRGKILSDGKRLFGDHKTWKGFVGMIGFGYFFQVFWGGLGHVIPALSRLNMVYETQPNTFWFNSLFGAGLGFAYVLCELPNSWLKRRFDIIPGQLAHPKNQRLFFFLLDQIDSLIGCVAVLALVYPMSIWLYLGFIALGALTHVGVNQLLFLLKLRKTQF